MTRRLFLMSLLVAMVLMSPTKTKARTTSCVFNTGGGVMALTGDCVTDETLLIPDGFTMDLNGFTIGAVDPVGGHFLGAVIRNYGTTAHVKNGTITAGNLANVCDSQGPPDNRLRAILFDGAGGSISGITIESLNQGASGCQEGNGIEVRNAPFDGTGTNPFKVEIAGNFLSNWQKTGIVTNGNVDAWIHHNTINQSFTQANLAANSLQVGFGAKALVEHNHIAGNSWPGGYWAATAILLYDCSAGTIVRRNELMEGNADVGLDVECSGVVIDNNKIFESGEDGPDYDIALGNWGSDNTITNNKAKGYATPYDGDINSTNKAIPAPSKQ